MISLSWDIEKYKNQSPVRHAWDLGYSRRTAQSLSEVADMIVPGDVWRRDMYDSVEDRKDTAYVLAARAPKMDRDVLNLIGWLSYDSVENLREIMKIHIYPKQFMFITHRDFAYDRWERIGRMSIPPNPLDIVRDM